MDWAVNRLQRGSEACSRRLTGLTGLTGGGDWSGLWLAGTLVRWYAETKAPALHFKLVCEPGRICLCSLLHAL